MKNLRGSSSNSSGGSQSKHKLISAVVDESAPLTNNDFESQQLPQLIVPTSVLRKLKSSDKHAVQEWADDDDDDDDDDFSSEEDSLSVISVTNKTDDNANQSDDIMESSDATNNTTINAGKDDTNNNVMSANNNNSTNMLDDLSLNEGGDDIEEVASKEEEDVGQIKESINNNANSTNDDGSGDTEEEEDTVTELEEGELTKDDDDVDEDEEEEEIEVLDKDDSKQGMNNETEIVDDDENEVQEDEEEEDDSDDENDSKLDANDGELDLKADDDDDDDEKDELVFKKVDEDDAFIPEDDDDEESAVGEDEGGEEQINKGNEGELKENSQQQEEEEQKEEEDQEEEEDLDSAQKQQDAETTIEADEEGSKEELESSSIGKDEQTDKEKVESKLETIAHDEDTVVDEDLAEQLEEGMEEVLEESIEIDDEEELGDSSSGGNGSIDAAIEDDEEEKVVDESNTNEEEIEVASETKDESDLCQDDPNFEYKGKEGFDCTYIKTKKPDKCNKKHDGVKVGLLSCPVSCGMVDECIMVLQQQQQQKKKKDVAVVTSSDETVVTEKSIETVDNVEIFESDEESPVAANDDGSDESTATAATEQKDDEQLQLEKEMESELETALEEGTVDEETAEKLDEEMLEALEEGVGEVFEKELEEELGLTGEDSDEEVSDELSKDALTDDQDGDKDLAIIDSSSFNEDSSDVELDELAVVANVTISEDDSSVCQDDPHFKFKGYEGFNCAYIKKNKPEKCNKMHSGEKVGVVSCPVSCGMVDACMALQESKVDAALDNTVENDETGIDAALEEDTDVTGTTPEETVDEEAEDTPEGTEDDETTDETSVEVVEDSGDTHASAAGNLTEVVIDTEDETEDDGGEELLTEQNSTLSDEKATEIDETIGLCQDDPDFKFKGYEGFNCAYIKENKPEKCNKIHSGEKVGVVSCPVSCGMVDECMALQESKVDAVLDNAVESDEMGSDAALEEDTDVTDAAAEETVDEGTEEALEGTEDDEATDETSVEVAEGSGDTHASAVGNSTEVAIDTEDANEEDGGEQLLTEQNSTLTDEEATEIIDETIGLCQDDPDFKFKGYEGFNCAYIKENKPEKCNKIHSGEKVGVVSCPVSCGMVDECMALQEQKVDAVLDNAVENDETGSDAALEKDTDVTGTTPEETIDEGTEDTREGTEDDETTDETSVEVVEGSGDTHASAVGNTTEVAIDTEDAIEDDGSEELLTEQNSTLSDEKATEMDETIGLCQDDPDFKFKGYEGFNCAYIKENKPEKCNKMHSGEKVGVVSCPVSCGMIDECMTLQEQKGSADITHLGSEEEEISNATAEDNASRDTTDPTAEASTVSSETDSISDMSEDELDEEVDGLDDKSSINEDETTGEAKDDTEGANETDSNDMYEAQVDTQATVIPPDIEQDDDDEIIEDQSLSDVDLEEEIEAKLEKALEEGELDEEEAQELEDEMEEALEEGIGEIFEAELDKELRCKDDPDFVIVDDDGQLRNCSWLRYNEIEKCRRVHEYTGKLIGEFFCPEACGMEVECEMVSAVDSTLQSPETETDDSFEVSPKGIKSMADEIETENGFENGNIYGNEMNEPSQEYNQEQTSYVGYSQPTNGENNWQGYGGENQQGGSFDNNPQPINYDENWLEDDDGFPFGLLILLFLGVGFFIFRKSQNSSRLQDNSRGGYQRVERQNHTRRYED